MSNTNPFLVLFVCLAVTIAMTIIGVCTVGVVGHLIDSVRDVRKKKAPANAGNITRFSDVQIDKLDAVRQTLYIWPFCSDQALAKRANVGLATARKYRAQLDMVVDGQPAREVR